MDRVNTLTEIVAMVVASYHTRAWKADSYFVPDPRQDLYMVLDIPEFPRKDPATVVVMARIVGDYVVVDTDTTDRPLVQELVRYGIPREKIVLRYQGETLPEAS